MRLLLCAALGLLAGTSSAAVIKRADSFAQGQPFDPTTGKGATFSGMFSQFGISFCFGTYAETPNHQGGTNHQIDLQNPDGLGQQSTDAGTVPNLKWPFSLSKTKIFPGGWTRTQVVQDLHQSHDIAAAQQHLRKGAIRELHWHKVVCLIWVPGQLAGEYRN